MNKDPITLDSVPKVKDVYQTLKEHGHPMYPVLNKSGQLIGKISANALIVLIEQKAWYTDSFSRE
jgi:CBS domain-containing protein